MADVELVSKVRKFSEVKDMTKSIQAEQNTNFIGVFSKRINIFIEYKDLTFRKKNIYR